MPWKDPQSGEAKEYARRWWVENKHKKNQEQIRINNQKYSKTEKGIKKRKIRDWRIGHNIVCEDWDNFYDNVWLKATHCDDCNLEFGTDRTNRKNLEHHHASRHIRAIVCHNCNCNRAKVDRLKMSVCMEIHRNYFLNK